MTRPSETDAQRHGRALVIRTGIAAPTNRRAKDDHRDQLAADVEAFLAGGGKIETLQGCGDQKHRRVGHGAGLGI